MSPKPWRWTIILGEGGAGSNVIDVRSWGERVNSGVVDDRSRGVPAEDIFGLGRTFFEGQLRGQGLRRASA